MMSMLTVLLLGLLRIGCGVQTFSGLTMTTSSSAIHENITFDVQFTVTRTLRANESIIFRLPRLFSASQTDVSNVVMAPTSLFTSTWHDGALDPTGAQYPYDDSWLELRLLDGVVLTTGRAVTVTVFEANGIGAYCGFPGSDEYFGAAYQSRLAGDGSLGSTQQLWSAVSVPMAASRAVLSNGTLGAVTSDFAPFSSFPGVGAGCSDTLDGCSGHGVCDHCNRRCLCDEGYGAADDLVPRGLGTRLVAQTCAMRTCPSGRAIGDLPSAPDKAHRQAECSNHGSCNRTSGQCACYPPYAGPACSYMTCPTAVPGKQCSGHGVCWNIAEISADGSDPQVYGSSALARETIAWDHNVMHGCLCNSSWAVGFKSGEYQLGEYYQPDCGLRRCPSGDNPYTCEDEEDCSGATQLGGTQKGELGNKCHVECSNRGSCNRITGVCSCYVGSIGVACELLAPGIFEPPCSPTGQPTSNPTRFFRPTGQPTGMPSGEPTSMPTQYLFLPSNVTSCVTAPFTDSTTAIINCTLENRILDHEAVVFCGAYLTPRSLQPHPAAPLNADDIIRHANSALSLEGQVSVQLTGLTPSTEYDFYCATVSSVGTQSPIELILSSKMSNITTACCKQVFVDVTTIELVEGKFIAQGLSVTSSALPSNRFRVHVTMEVVSGGAPGDVPGSVSRNVSLSSTSLPINSNMVTVDGTVTHLVDVGATLLSAGLYRVNATLSGVSAAEYEVVYGNRVLTVVNDTAVPPVPVLKSARFSNDGGSVTVRFDTSTDRGRATTVAFVCGALLNFTGHAQSTCAWVDDETVSIRPSTLVLPGVTNISVAAGTIRAKCTPTARIPCAQWGFVSSAVKVVAAYPAAAVVPVVQAMGPASIGSCGSLLLDLTSSTGSGGRAWAGRPVFALLTTTSSNATLLMNYLNSQYQYSPPVAIPSMYLQGGAKYKFKITLCNFLQKCGNSQYFISVEVEAMVPVVSILGAYQRTMNRKSVLQLNTNSFLRNCDGSVSYRGMNYSWAVYPDSALFPSKTLISASTRDRTKFTLGAFALQAGHFYKVEVLVTGVLNGLRSRANVIVTVVPGKVVAVITGGADLSVRYGATMTIDGSKSYDEDSAVGANGGVDLRYEWACVQMIPTYSLACPFSTAVGQSRLQVTSLVVANSTAKITMTVSDQSGERFSSAIVSVTGVPPTAPTITMVSVVNNPTLVAVKTTLTANILSSFPCTSVWSMNETSVPLSSIASASVSKAVPAGKLTNVYLPIKANALKPRYTYLFRISCGPSVASIVVSTNGPPLFGTFTTTPSRGTAVTTQFLFSADQWFDEDLPIMYEFGFLATSARLTFATDSVSGGTIGDSKEVNNVMTIRSLSEVTFGYSMLPAGNVTSNYDVTCLAYIRDALGSTITRQSTVNVLPLNGTTAFIANISATETLPSTALEQLLISATNNSFSRETSSSSVDTTKQVIATFSSIINRVNCSSAPNCTALNRSPCRNVVNTCGACLVGHVGDQGAQNTACTRPASSGVQNIGGVIVPLAQLYNTTCANSTDCVRAFGSHYRCDVAYSLCYVPEKTCQGNCTSAAQGRCVFKNVFSGVTVPSCHTNDLSCTATCKCAGGYGGVDCSKEPAEVAASKSVRTTLITSFKSLTESENPTENVVRSWVKSLSSLSQVPDELTPASSTSLLATTLSVVGAAQTVDLPFDDLIDALSAVDDVSRATSRAALVEDSIDDDSVAAAANQSKAIIDACSEVLMRSLVPGEATYVASFDSFRIVAAAHERGSDNESQPLGVVIPRTDYEVLLGTAASSMSIDRSVWASPDEAAGDVKSIKFGAVSTRAMQYGDTNRTGITSNPLTMQLSMPFDRSPRNASNENVSFVYIVQQNVENQLYSTTVSNTTYTTICLPFVVRNYTYDCWGTVANVTHVCTGKNEVLSSNCSTVVPTPQCTNVIGSTPQVHTDCVLVTYNQTTTTCKCPLDLSPFRNTSITNGGSAGRRRLAVDNSALAGSSGLVTQHSAPIGTLTVDRYRALPLLSKDLDLVLDSSYAMALLYGLILMIFCGCCFFTYKTYRTYFDAGSGLPPKKAAKRVEGENSSKLTGYIRELFPTAFLTVELTSTDRIVKELKKHHRLLRALRFPRTVEERNMILLSYSYLLSVVAGMFFLLAMFHNADNPADDDSCGHHYTQHECLARVSPFNSDKTYCLWQEQRFLNVVAYACTYKPTYMAPETALYIAVMAAVLLGAYDAVLEYCFRIIAAPLLPKSSDAESKVRRFLTYTKNSFPAVFTRLPNDRAARAAAALDDAELSKIETGSAATVVRVSARKSGTSPVSPGARQRRMSTQSIAMSDSMLASRNTLSAVSRKASVVIQSEISRRQSVRQSIRMSISGAPNVAGGEFRVALQALFNLDELVADAVGQMSLIKTLREKKVFIKAWHLTGNNGEPLPPNALHMLGFDEKLETKLNNHFKALKVEVKEKSEELQGATDPQISVELMRLFVVDLLGKDTDAARLFANKSREEFMQFDEVSMDAKVVAVLFVVIATACFVGVTIWLTVLRNSVWQVGYVTASLLQLLVTVLVFETSAVLTANYALPQLVAKDVQSVFTLVSNLADDVARQVDGIGLSERSEIRMNCAPVLLDAPSYLFVSTQLAQRHTQLLESMLILSYETYLPGPMLDHWARPNPELNSPFSAAGGKTILHRIELIPSYLATSWTAAVGMFASKPIYLQIMLVKLCQPALFGMSALLLFLFAQDALAASVGAPVVVCAFVLAVYGQRLWDSVRQMYVVRRVLGDPAEDSGADDSLPSYGDLYDEEAGGAEEHSSSEESSSEEESEEEEEEEEEVNEWDEADRIQLSDIDDEDGLLDVDLDVNASSDGESKGEEDEGTFRSRPLHSLRTSMKVTVENIEGGTPHLKPELLRPQAPLLRAEEGEVMVELSPQRPSSSAPASADPRRRLISALSQGIMASKAVRTFSSSKYASGPAEPTEEERREGGREKPSVSRIYRDLVYMTGRDEFDSDEIRNISESAEHSGLPPRSAAALPHKPVAPVGAMLSPQITRRTPPVRVEPDAHLEISDDEEEEEDEEEDEDEDEEDRSQPSALGLRPRAPSASAGASSTASPDDALALSDDDDDDDDDLNEESFNED